MEVPVELARILITEMADQQVIFLREKGGDRAFPIMIGTTEAMAIDRRIKNHLTPRPMTHDLLASVIDALGGTLEKIVINDLRDHTFFATIYVRKDDTLIEIDSRPSDAIALSAGTDTPLFVAEEVLDAILRQPPPTHLEKIELLRRRMAMLAETIIELTEQLNDKDFLAANSAAVIQEQRRQLAEMKNEYDQIDRVLKKLG